MPGFVNYKKGCTRLAAASDQVYQLLAHGRWFSPGTPASSTTKTGRHDIAKILLKVVLNTKNQIIKPDLLVPVQNNTWKHWQVVSLHQIFFIKMCKSITFNEKQVFPFFGQGASI